MGAKKRFRFEELLIAAVVIASLATLAAPRIAMSQPSYKTNACQANIVLLNAKIDQYYRDTGHWPGSLDELVVEGYLPDGLPKCPYGETYLIGPEHYIAEHKH
ncbi:MAG: hypothetical protein JW804_06900 [Sedimentisphaerales bacterium]|nr:hypothetical protein [Sedimentisphaerales bacterium]